MNSNSWMVGALAAALLLGTAGCERNTAGLEPVSPNTDPIVFLDDFGQGVDFQAFSGSRLDAVSIDTGERYQGSASLKISVPLPPPGTTTGTYAGGAFTTRPSRDLSPYNALTFWARASKTSRLNVAGLGNDNTGTSKYEARWKSIPLTTTWTQYYVPIPFPERLTSERGLFFFAEDHEGNAPHEVWFDEIQFVNTPQISNPRPTMTTESTGGLVGMTLLVKGTQTTFRVGSVDQVIEHMPGYFTYASSNEDVARVTDGLIRIVGGGNTVITANLGAVAASGAVTLFSATPPATPAPTPTLPAGDVRSLFSNTYTSFPVTSWSADWDRADLVDWRVAGNDTKAYTSFVYAGIEFTAPTLDATAMTHFHIDVWAATGTVFKVKLVDFGEDGAYLGAPDSEQELSFTASSSPSFASGGWVSLDVPLADFTDLMSRAHLAQLILAGDGKAILVDNIYFHK